MGEGQLSTGLCFSAEFLGQLSTSGKFRPGLILTGQILITKVYEFAVYIHFSKPSLNLLQGEFPVKLALSSVIGGSVILILVITFFSCFIVYKKRKRRAKEMMM